MPRHVPSCPAVCFPAPAVSFDCGNSGTTSAHSQRHTVRRLVIWERRGQRVLHGLRCKHADMSGIASSHGSGLPVSMPDVACRSSPVRVPTVGQYRPAEGGQRFEQACAMEYGWACSVCNERSAQDLTAISTVLVSPRLAVLTNFTNRSGKTASGIGTAPASAVSATVACEPSGLKMGA